MTRRWSLCLLFCLTHLRPPTNWLSTTNRFPAWIRAWANLSRFLRRQTEYDKTLIVYASDNGMAFPGAKTNLYDPGMRLPLVVRSPEQKRRGVVDLCNGFVGGPYTYVVKLSRCKRSESTSGDNGDGHRPDK